MLNLPYSCRIATAEQCRDADRTTIKQFGLDGFTLMETAGLQAAHYIADQFTGMTQDPNRNVNDTSSPNRLPFPTPAVMETPVKGRFYCGKGNNGGDAMVVARYLAIHHGHACQILFPDGRDGLTPDAARNLTLLEKLQKEGYPLHFPEPNQRAGDSPPNYIVDGLLGTGLNAPVRAPLDRSIEEINDTPCPVYSMDVPSGLHADNGDPLPFAVRADVTFSFGLLKPGFYLSQGPIYSGQVVPCNLTFPASVRTGIADLVTPDILTSLPPVHRTAEHKYSDRVVFVIAGSDGLTGAAMLSARAAWRSGTGAVFLITPRGTLPIYEQSLPEIVKRPVGTLDDYRFLKEHVPPALEILNSRKGVLLIGPGIGRHPSTLQFVQEILTEYHGNTVVDADALHAPIDLPGRSPGMTILTPHTGELDVLTDKRVNDGFQRLQWTGDFARKNRVYVVSKGSPTMTGTPSGHCYLTGYNTRIFARAGFGDVLSGTITGYLAITGEAESSILHALIHGKVKADESMAKTGRLPEPAELL